RPSGVEPYGSIRHRQSEAVHDRLAGGARPCGQHRTVDRPQRPDEIACVRGVVEVQRKQRHALLLCHELVDYAAQRYAERRVRSSAEIRSTSTSRCTGFGIAASKPIFFSRVSSSFVTKPLNATI